MRRSQSGGDEGGAAAGRDAGGGRAAAAELIALDAARLARMAAAHGMAMLAYVLDMAVLEAWRAATEGETDEGAVEEARPDAARRSP